MSEGPTGRVPRKRPIGDLADPVSTATGPSSRLLPPDQPIGVRLRPFPELPWSLAGLVCRNSQSRVSVSLPLTRRLSQEKEASPLLDPCGSPTGKKDAEHNPSADLTASAPQSPAGGPEPKQGPPGESGCRSALEWGWNFLCFRERRWSESSSSSFTCWFTKLVTPPPYIKIGQEFPSNVCHIKSEIPISL